MADLLDKDSEIAILKMFKEIIRCLKMLKQLKEDVNKVKKTMY